MSRAAVVSLCAILAAAAVRAAPAPLQQPSWTRGWDTPIDPVGDCRFTYKTETLAISVPGKGHDLESELKAPRLLRPVEGDFVVGICVSGNFRPMTVEGNGIIRAAGLYLTDGIRFVCLERVAGLCTPTLGLGIGNTGKDVSAPIQGRKGMGFDDGPSLLDPAWLQIKRQGGRLSSSFSTDGRTWVPLKNATNVRLGHKLKVGVVVEVARGEVFIAEFSKFKLTKAGK
jgi:hypothetical protein